MKYPTSHPFYLLAKNDEPYPVYDVHEWAKQFPAQHLVERTEIDGTGFVVETVFMGKISVYDQIGRMQTWSPPCLFETVVYAANGQGVDGDKYQQLGNANKIGSAKRGHQIKVRIWRENLGVDPA